jgi:hypothetical protein
MPNQRAVNIRWLILVILMVQRQEGSTEIGGWLNEEVLRRTLAAEGYPLSRDELRIYCDFLADQTVGCIEIKRLGDMTEPRCKVRLTARGMRVAGREITVSGIGVTEEDA